MVLKKSKFKFEYRIILFMLTALSLICVSGIYTYSKISKTVENIQLEAGQDLRLALAESIQSESLEAESNVKSFNISEDSSFIRSYYMNVKKVEEKLIYLDEIQTNSPIFSFNVDSLKSLLNRKFDVLEQLMSLRADFRNEISIDNIADKIELKSQAATLNSEEKGLLKRIFKKSTNSKTSTVVEFRDVNRELAKMKLREDSLREQLRTKEFELLVTDIEISHTIKTMIDKLELSSKQQLQYQEAALEEQMISINRQIAIFCIAMCVMLLFMSYTIYNYVRKNKSYRKALRLAKIQAEDLAVTKERFLSNMSHEIRTPMNAIAGFTDQIAQGKLNESQREHVGMIQKSIEHLLYLINDVLDISKLDAGKLKLEKIAFNSRDTITEVVSFVKQIAKDKDIDVSLDIDDNVAPILIGDPYRLRQILLNVMSNSVKFTDNGSVELVVNKCVKSDQHTIRFEIKDTGIGMSDHQINKVFEQFEQAEVSTTRNYGGTGLGLSITNKLVDLHEGKIFLKSKSGEGTTVIIELPYEIGSPSDLTVEKSNADKLMVKDGLNILIVDDAEFNRKLLTTIFDKHPVNYDTADDGIKAIEAVKKKKYDLILMDIRMPKMGGIEATKAIRKLEQNDSQQVNIIALTAAVMREDVESYYSAGMNGFLSKPITEDKLIKELSHILCESPESNGVRKEIESTSETEQIASASVNFDQLKDISNGDRAFYLDMLETFISGTNEGIENIENALEIEDWNALANYAHKISSPCKHMGAEGMYQILKRLEHNCRNGENLSNCYGLVNKLKSQSEVVLGLVKIEKENTNSI